MNFLHHKDPLLLHHKDTLLLHHKDPFFSTTRVPSSAPQGPFFCTTRPTRTNRTNIFSRYWIHLFSCIFFLVNFFSSESVINVGDVKPAVTRSRKTMKINPINPKDQDPNYDVKPKGNKYILEQ